MSDSTKAQMWALVPNISQYFKSSLDIIIEMFVIRTTQCLTGVGPLGSAVG